MLRALDYLWRMATSVGEGEVDERLRPALDLLVSKRDPDGTWDADWTPPGRGWFDMEPTGEPLLG